MELLPIEVKAQIQNRDVKIKAWLYNVKSLTGGMIPHLFLDTDLETFQRIRRSLTSYMEATIDTG